MELNEEMVQVGEDLILLTTTLSNESSIPLSTLSCCDMTPRGLNWTQWFTFWVEGVLIMTVGLFGLFGNILSISVLIEKEMRNAFNCLLIVLAAVDSFLLVFAMFDYSIVRAFGLSFDIYTYMFPYFLYPGTNLVLCMSIFMVVAIAFERFLAVCKPYEYRAMSTTQSVTQRVLKLSLPVFIFAFLINIPKFFETELKLTPLNGTEEFQVSYVVTKLRKNPSYINYYVNWFRLLGTGAFPMLALIYLNVNIYLKIVETQKAREVRRHGTVVGGSSMVINHAHSCVGDENSNSEPQRRKQEALSKKDIKMATILLSIVMVFFGCHLPRVLLNLHEFFMLSQMNQCGDNFCPPAWFLCSISVNHFLLVINSSVNILVYCSQGEKFRQGLKDKLCIKTILNCPIFHVQWLKRELDQDVSLAILNGPPITKYPKALVPRPEISTQFLAVPNGFPSQKHGHRSLLA